MARKQRPNVTFGELVAKEQLADDEFRGEWQRLAPAREFAAMLIEYRADHGLSQRALGERLGVSQPRVARMESGEHNPDVETIIATVDKLGTEFVVAFAPVERGAQFVKKSAQVAGAVVRHGNVAVTTASARASGTV